MNESQLVARIDQIIELGNAALSTKRELLGIGTLVDTDRSSAFKAAGLSFIGKIFGSEHSHYELFSNRLRTISHAEGVREGIAILSVIKTEIEGGWLRSLSSLVAADLFSDFLEMADHLLVEGYKDAAAVMVGSTLEEHLRRLCSKYGVEPSEEKDGKRTSKKAARLNEDLAKAGAYNKVQQQIVLGWLGIRNQAAHGHYDQYEAGQVQTMHQGVQQFIALNPE